MVHSLTFLHVHRLSWLPIKQCTTYTSGQTKYSNSKQQSIFQVVDNRNSFYIAPPLPIQFHNFLGYNTNLIAYLIMH